MAPVLIEGLRFFLDRNLGAYVVPGALRAAGWALTTMDERYGSQKSQRIGDEQWIADASRRGEVLLCKDTAIASNPAEARVVYMHAAQVFALTDAASDRRSHGTALSRSSTGDRQDGEQR